jgi:cardiolipin synthase
LAERAKVGVDVRLIIDGVGSLRTDDRFLAPLSAAGGRVIRYRPPAPWRPRWGFWKRDHRKLLVVDDRVGFIGGINVGLDYAPESWGGAAWHDVHARVDGPAAVALAAMADRTWRWHTGEPVVALVRPSPQGEVGVQVIENRLRQRFTIHRAYLRAIKRAQRTIRIANAYFVPTPPVQRALRRAARRGVVVELLLAGRSDVKAMQYASHALYGRLMKSGIAIYEWTAAVLHAKCAVIDGCWCSIGSYNFNRRSLVHDLEANMACVDPMLGLQMDAQFDLDRARSTRIDPETWHRRPAYDKLLEQVFYALRVLL